MRKSNFGCSSVQRQNVLKPRNTDMTPNSRLSSGVKKVRGSTEGNHRLSQITGRYTPTRSNIPRYTPVRNLGPSSNNLVPPAPSSVSRLSVESVRNSSVGGKNRKETRPIGDPSFKSECIDKVLDFLVANGYNYEIHRRNLLNPSTKDFAQIFTFIYHHMNPTHTLPHKLEEEIPQLMKLLKYPNQLSKSTFISVGSRHTWPTVLAMLAWMIDIIGIYDISDPLSIAFPCDFDIESSIINKKVSKFFDIYECDDEDEVLKQHEEYYHALEELFEIRTQDMISQQEYSEKLDEEISIASRGPERLEQLQTQFEQLLIDKEKMECHIKEIQVHVTAKETEKAQLECTHAEFKAEASQLNEDQLRLEAIKAKQALSAGELARFKNHAKDVAVLITQLQAQGNEMDSQIWNLQMSLGKSQKELSDKVSSHNSLVTELELGEAFEIDCSNIADNMQYWRKQLISGLYESKKNTKHASYDSQSNKLRKDEELAVVQENLKEKKGEIEKLESKLRRVEEDITLTKSEILNEEKEMQQENERLHQQIIEARKGQKSSLYQKQYCVDQAKEELEATKAHGKERMILGAEFLVKVCNRTLEDLDFKTSATGQFKENVTKCCKELLVNTKNLVNVGNLMTNKCEK
ncbi:kinetochore protein NDC80 homolog [Macrobrachium nipponense]|uniref:kinetochore protein NDC80 homolog n=1 Tax=Macrobrachium nipponense TaxID=159736 RepID=UPI0030C8A102